VERRLLECYRMGVIGARGQGQWGRMVRLQSALGPTENTFVQPLQKFASGEAEFAKQRVRGGAGDFGNGSFIAEDFDDPLLTPVPGMPVSAGTIAHMVGVSIAPRKANRRVRVYDYADLDVPMPCYYVRQTLAGVTSARHNILLPASAVLGGRLRCPAH